MFAGWTNGPNPALVGSAGLGGQPGYLFFLPQREKRLWNRKSSRCRRGKWGFGGVSPMPEAVIKAWPTNNSHPVNLLKSYIVSHRHFGKGNTFLYCRWPLRSYSTLRLWGLLQCAQQPGSTQTPPRVSLASLKGQWNPQVTWSFEASNFRRPK